MEGSNFATIEDRIASYLKELYKEILLTNLKEEVRLSVSDHQLQYQEWEI